MATALHSNALDLVARSEADRHGDARSRTVVVAGVIVVVPAVVGPIVRSVIRPVDRWAAIVRAVRTTTVKTTVVRTWRGTVVRHVGTSPAAPSFCLLRNADTD